MGETPLFTAASSGNVVVVTSLLALGADAAARRRDGRAPLWAALRNAREGGSSMDHLNIVLFLWRSGGGDDELVEEQVKLSLLLYHNII